MLSKQEWKERFIHQLGVEEARLLDSLDKYERQEEEAGKQIECLRDNITSIRALASNLRGIE